jgi:stage III sporulation protein AD
MNFAQIFGGNTAEYVAVMLKGLGVALLTHSCSSVCRDCGKGSVADWVEFAGKLEILLLCFPLMSEIITTAVGLLDLK